MYVFCITFGVKIFIWICVSSPQFWEHIVWSWFSHLASLVSHPIILLYLTDDRNHGNPFYVLISHLYSAIVCWNIRNLLFTLLKKKENVEKRTNVFVLTFSSCFSKFQKLFHLVLFLPDVSTLFHTHPIIVTIFYFGKIVCFVCSPTRNM